MMRIESLSAQPDRVGRHRVVLEDGSVLRLYRQTVEDFELYPGKELEEQEYTKLLAAAGKMSAKMRAVRIVAAGNVSKGDLERRLVQKGEKTADAKQAVAWMEDLDLLDDQRTAQLVVDRCISRGYGLARAKQALYEKKIPKQYWEAALESYPDQTEKILEFLHTRLGEQWDQRDLRRVTDSLLRRGHSYGEIRKAMQIYAETVDFREEQKWQM